LSVRGHEVVAGAIAAFIREQEEWPPQPAPNVQPVTRSRHDAEMDGDGVGRVGAGGVRRATGQ
jgi:hypothetical protein